MNTIKTTRVALGMLAASALGLTLALNSGCVVAAVGAAGAAGAGTVAFVEGKLTTRLDNHYESVVHATDISISQLQFARISEKQDALSAEFTARTVEDKKIDILVAKEAEHLIRVEIRVGTFGDKQASLMILDRIKSNL